MAINGNFRKPSGSQLVDICTLYGKASVGGSGATTLSATRSPGISSFLNSAANTYLITLDEVYSDLVGFNYNWMSFNAASDIDIDFAISSQSIANGGKTITLKSWNRSSDTQAGEPGSGHTLYFQIVLQNNKDSVRGD